MGAAAEKTAQEYLAEAAKARQEASHFRRAALVIRDESVAASLRRRAGELENRAAVLEAQAMKESAK